MSCRRIAIHAASGLKQDEFDWGVWRRQKHGVACPRPDQLPRGAIIGAVDVVKIISKSDSEWFGGQTGLVLENAEQCDPIPVKGELGYFAWQRADTLVPVAKWMSKWGTGGDGLFEHLEASWRVAPRKPSKNG